MTFPPFELPPHQPQPTGQPVERDDMAQRLNSWAPSPSYGPSRPMGESYFPYENESPRLPPPSNLMSGPSNSQPHPYARQQQPQYHRPEYHHHHEYKQEPPSPIYQQPPPHYQHHQPPPQQQQQQQPLLNDPYRPAPMHGYPAPETPHESPTVLSAPSEAYDEFQAARDQHFMMRNQPPPMPGAPRVLNDNYQGKVPIPCTPAALRIPPVRSGSNLSAAGSSTWSASTWSASTDRVKIEDLLTEQRKPERKPDALRNEYEIFFRQQPVAARCCGYGERDRRVIDPPPIVQLRINNPDLSPDELYDKIHHPAYVVSCSIWSADGDEDQTNMPTEYVRPGKRLMGSLVSSPFVGQDENGEEGCFFCFPDMSVRTPGSFRLKFVLVVVSIGHRVKAPIVSTIMSDVFTVYNAKDFPGMQASTPLTKRLKEQGCLISIKKGNDKGEKSGGKNSRQQEDSDDDEEGGGSSTKRKKSKKQR